MSQVSKDTAEILSYIVAKKITNPTVFVELFTSLGDALLHSFRSSKADPMALAYLSLVGTMPLLRASQAGMLEEALSEVIGLCGQCRASSACPCARKLKLLGTARALRDEIIAFSEDPEIKALLTRMRQS